MIKIIGIVFFAMLFFKSCFTSVIFAKKGKTGEATGADLIGFIGGIIALVILFK
jgi:hypothetical protein